MAGVLFLVCKSVLLETHSCGRCALPGLQVGTTVRDSLLTASHGKWFACEVFYAIMLLPFMQLHA